MEKLGEQDVLRLLVRRRWTGRSFLLPRFAPSKWWECDLFEVTGSGYFREYEVKTSRSDFLRDGQKRSRGRYVRIGGKWEETSGARKHQLLADGSPRGPKQFWFVTPQGLVELDEVPEFAGLIVITDRQQVRELRPAPVLHRQKLADGELQRAKDNAWHRLMQREFWG